MKATGTRTPEAKLRRELVEVCQRLAALGLIGAAEGNVSARLDAKRILATPSGSNKVRIRPAELIVCDLDGRRLRGKGKPSTELQMHVAVYRARPDVEAIVHAHPVTAVAFTLAGIELSEPMMPEAVTVLGGGIPTAPYATPSTAELARVVAETLGRREACLMERHGAIAVGGTPYEACDRMETIERMAMVLLRARHLGPAPRPLPADEVEKLLRMSGRR